MRLFSAENLSGYQLCSCLIMHNHVQTQFRMCMNNSGIVFAPKYRRKIFYGENRAEIGKILRELCDWKGVHIIEGEVCPDHIHMLVEIPPKMSVSSFMGFLKGKSSIIIHQRHGNLKYKYGNRSFWCRGYYVDTAGKNAKRIQEYIKNQLKEDQIHDQMTIRGWEDPLTGSKK